MTVRCWFLKTQTVLVVWQIHIITWFQVLLLLSNWNTIKPCAADQLTVPAQAIKLRLFGFGYISVIKTAFHRNNPAKELQILVTNLTLTMRPQSYDNSKYRYQSALVINEQANTLTTKTEQIMIS